MAIRYFGYVSFWVSRSGDGKEDGLIYNEFILAFRMSVITIALYMLLLLFRISVTIYIELQDAFAIKILTIELLVLLLPMVAI